MFSRILCVVLLFELYGIRRLWTHSIKSDEQSNWCFSRTGKYCSMLLSLTRSRWSTCRYPVRYVYSQFKKLFARYSTESDTILPKIHEEHEFLRLRRQLLLEPTPAEYGIAATIAKQMLHGDIPSTDNPLVQSILLKWRNKQDAVIIHYTHEGQFSHYKSAIHDIWKNNFNETPVISSRLIVGTRNNLSLNRELVRRSPCVRGRRHPMANPNSHTRID